MESNYFTSYEDIEIHRLMLQDKPRTQAYRDAILKNQHLFKNKLVLDVGAGTGIISLFAAKAGAKKVYAVEASSLAEEIAAIASENGFSQVIDVFHTKIENFALPTQEKVDVVISEWMGFYLLHESMLSSVLYARDHFLAADGVLFPSQASLYAAPCSLETFYKDHFSFWDDVYGFKMSAIKGRAFRERSSKPEICNVPASDLLAEPVCINTFNLQCMSEQETEFTRTNFVGISKSGIHQGIVLWFDCEFDGRTYNEDGDEIGTLISFSTSPLHPVTHWKQTVIILGPLPNSPNLEDDDNLFEELPEIAEIEEDPCDEASDKREGVAGGMDNGSAVNLLEEDEIIGWKLEFKKSEENTRHYNITIEMLDPETSEHPIPCPCPMPRCLIIAKMIENEDKQEDDVPI